MSASAGIQGLEPIGGCVIYRRPEVRYRIRPETISRRGSLKLRGIPIKASRFRASNEMTNVNCIFIFCMQILRVGRFRELWQPLFGIIVAISTLQKCCRIVRP
jgi:hypothetical protein